MNADGDRRGKVTVDSEARRLYLGLRVRHAIGWEQARRVEQGEAVVEDGDGNRLDLDGALYDGQQLRLRIL